MKRGHSNHAKRQRGVTIFAVVLAVIILAILAYSLTTQALVEYYQAAQTRDTIALQQLTDSALAQALYYLNRGEREAAAKPVREAFGMAQAEVGETGKETTVRVAAHVPNAEWPRTSSRVLFRLQRDAKGRWTVASAADEPIPLGEGQARKDGER